MLLYQMFELTPSKLVWSMCGAADSRIDKPYKANLSNIVKTVFTRLRLMLVCYSCLRLMLLTCIIQVSTELPQASC